MNEKIFKKKRKGLKIFLSICGVLMALLLTLYLVATNNTQTVIGMLQKLSYGDNPINSYEPFYEPISGKTTDNILSAKLIMIANIRMAFST